jgi:hypothetical protein
MLQLQNTKRDLADAIVNADNSVIRNLGREDLELLLSRAESAESSRAAQLSMNLQSWAGQRSIPSTDS